MFVFLSSIQKKKIIRVFEMWIKLKVMSVIETDEEDLMAKKYNKLNPKPIKFTLCPLSCVLTPD